MLLVRVTHFPGILEQSGWAGHFWDTAELGPQQMAFRDCQRALAPCFCGDSPAGPWLGIAQAVGTRRPLPLAWRIG